MNPSNDMRSPAEQAAGAEPKPVKWDAQPLRPALVEESRRDKAGNFTLTFTRAAAEAIEDAYPTPRAPAGEEIVGKEGPCRWSLVAQFRAEAGKSLAEVSEAAGISVEELQEVEAADAAPDDFSSRELRKLAGAVGGTLESVFPFRRFYRDAKFTAEPPPPRPAKRRDTSLPPLPNEPPPAVAVEADEENARRRGRQLSHEIEDAKRALAIGDAQAKLAALRTPLEQQAARRSALTRTVEDAKQQLGAVRESMAKLRRR